MGLSPSLTPLRGVVSSRAELRHGAQRCSRGPRQPFLRQEERQLCSRSSSKGGTSRSNVRWWFQPWKLEGIVEVQICMTALNPRLVYAARGPTPKSSVSFPDKGDVRPEEPCCCIQHGAQTRLL